MARLLVVLVVLALAGGALLGCAAEDRAAAERARAVADAANAEARAAEAAAKIELARGEADAQREQARADALAQRAETRQMERDAAHGRLMATLPYVVVLVGAFLLAGAFVFVWADGRRRPATSTTDPAILVLLEQARRAELGQRELWHALAQLDRRAPAELPGGGQVVIYSDKGQR